MTNIDIYAYLQIERLKEITTENKISVPRLRGYRWMGEEKPQEEDGSYQIEAYNSYCGRKDILYVHARIGGNNWEYYEDEIVGKDKLVERIDDEFDCTYCDLYFKIKEPERDAHKNYAESKEYDC